MKNSSINKNSNNKGNNNSNNKNNKNNIAKNKDSNQGIFNLKLLGRIVLCVSFLPYVVGVILGIVYAIVGYDVLTVTGVYVKTMYGFEAFREVITWYGLGLTFIPVIPICFIFQLIYLLWWLVKRLRQPKML